MLPASLDVISIRGHALEAQQAEKLVNKMFHPCHPAHCRSYFTVWAEQQFPARVGLGASLGSWRLFLLPAAGGGNPLWRSGVGRIQTNVRQWLFFAKMQEHH